MKVLLDCGMYQGHAKAMSDFNTTWYFPPKDIDVLILSHAHIDHCGRIPRLVRDGFRGKIYCTHATLSLTTILLLDSAKIQESDAEYHGKHQKKKSDEYTSEEPLYTKPDVYRALEHFVTVGYEQWYNISDELSFMYRDAGHILGSATVSLKIQEKGKQIRLGFSADVGRWNRPILRDPIPMPESDYLLLESTYGDRLHLDAPHEEEKFLQILHHTCFEKKGKLIIPAFSVGRTQELLYMMDQLQHAGKLPRIPVYVDSPLAMSATDIYRTHPECYDEELLEYMMQDNNPFGFENMKFVRTSQASKALNGSDKPCIIISAAGMMNAGRVKHHLFNNVEDPRCTFLMVGYCSPYTPGGVLRSGAKEIRLFGVTKSILAEVAIMDSFSAHGDRDELIRFIENQKGHCKKLFLVHGEYTAQQHFQKTLNEQGWSDVIIPALGDIHTLAPL